MGEPLGNWLADHLTRWLWAALYFTVAALFFPLVLPPVAFLFPSPFDVIFSFLFVGVLALGFASILARKPSQRSIHNAENSKEQK